MAKPEFNADEKAIGLLACECFYHYRAKKKNKGSRRTLRTSISHGAHEKICQHCTTTSLAKQSSDMKTVS